MIKQQKNILINNVVPLNNGDVALFLSLYNALINKGYQVKIATYYYKQATKLYPDLPFIKELGDYKLFVKLPFLKLLLLPFLFVFSRAYLKADVIIGAPGGYINSNYNIKNSLSVFKIAKYFKKKTFIYAQSVGPLNSKDSVYLNELLSKFVDFIYVRDSVSLKVLQKLNTSKNKYKLTQDAAFLLKPNLSNKEKTNKVAISVRAWQYDHRNINKYQKMVVKMVQICIDSGFKVEFLSTCQGIKNYKNDALIAQAIYNKLPKNYQDKTSVLTTYFSFKDFYKKLDDYDFVIGTRLHMCITALTKLIPAFNISYEIKGKACYKYLNLANYSIDYNEPIENASKVLTNFIENQKQIQFKINEIIPKIHIKTVADFNDFIDYLD